MHERHRIISWQLASLYKGGGHPQTIPNRKAHKKTLPGMEASPMISIWHLCHGAIADKMGHSLGHRGDLTVKNISPIFKFSFNQEGRFGGPLWHFDLEK